MCRSYLEFFSEQTPETYAQSRRKEMAVEVSASVVANANEMGSEPGRGVAALQASSLHVHIICL